MKRVFTTQGSGPLHAPGLLSQSEPGNLFAGVALSAPPRWEVSANATVLMPLPTTHSLRLQAQMGSMDPLASVSGLPPRLPMPPVSVGQAGAGGGGVVTVGLAQSQALSRQLADTQAALDHATQEAEAGGALWHQLVRDFNIPDADLLCSAAAAGSHAAIREVLGRGGDINGLGASGLAPLHSAVLAGRADTARLLLGCLGVNLNQLSARGQTPLALAMLNTDAVMVNMLLADARTNPNLGLNQPPMSALSLAIFLKDATLARRLMHDGRLLLSQAASGNTGMRLDQIADTQGLPDIAAELRVLMSQPTLPREVAMVSRALPVFVPAPAAPRADLMCDQVLDAAFEQFFRSPSFEHLLGLASSSPEHP